MNEATKECINKGCDIPVQREYSTEEDPPRLSKDVFALKFSRNMETGSRWAVQNKRDCFKTLCVTQGHGKGPPG